MGLVVSEQGVKCTVEHARSVQANVVLERDLFQEFHFAPASPDGRESFALALRRTLPSQFHV